jgi:hypothetical protein
MVGSIPEVPAPFGPPLSYEFVLPNAAISFYRIHALLPELDDLPPRMRTLAYDRCAGDGNMKSLRTGQHRCLSEQESCWPDCDDGEFRLDHIDVGATIKDCLRKRYA